MVHQPKVSNHPQESNIHNAQDITFRQSACIGIVMRRWHEVPAQRAIARSARPSVSPRSPCS
ncbi:hypothetical protein [Scytonema sp. PRP1]|uniref:hypothetical protein n=1 Tax=Scytonema sp. PRP1 TaxID=3120513 RepID=UPI00300D1114